MRSEVPLSAAKTQPLAVQRSGASLPAMGISLWGSLPGNASRLAITTSTSAVLVLLVTPPPIASVNKDCSPIPLFLASVEFQLQRRTLLLTTTDPPPPTSLPRPSRQRTS